MTKKIKKSAGFLSFIIILLVCTIHAKAQLIIDMNQVDIQDTIYTCESVYGMFLYPDSRITQNSMWQISKIEHGIWMGVDTIYGDSISYFDPFTVGVYQPTGIRRNKFIRNWNRSPAFGFEYRIYRRRMQFRCTIACKY